MNKEKWILLGRNRSCLRTGRTVRHDDDVRNECFRAYKHPRDSYEDHSKFLKGRSRYASLFKLKITDYKG